MRLSFSRCLADLADEDERIVLLTADLGFMALDEFIDRHKQRFFNVGVAEQNMVGMATGLAEAGFLPFVYSIVPFAVLRPYEFIRNGPVLHKLPVRVVGVGAGVEYGTNGLTHYGLEDLAVTRVQPGMTVLAPADFKQAQAVLRATWALPGPIYYRLGKDDKREVPGLDGRFTWDGVEVLGDGPDAVLLTTSSIAFSAVEAADKLAGQGIAVTVGVVAQISPPPSSELVRLLSRFPLVVTLENHYSCGALGSMVAELIAEQGLRCRLIRRGIDFKLDGRSGSTAFLHEAYGLSPERLAKDVGTALSGLRA